MKQLHSRIEIDSTSTAVARNVVWLRRRREMSRHELARAAGISCCTLRRMESGSSNPQLCAVNRVAVALGVSVNRLLWDGETTSGRVIRRAMDKAQEVRDA